METGAEAIFLKAFGDSYVNFFGDSCVNCFVCEFVGYMRKQGFWKQLSSWKYQSILWFLNNQQNGTESDSTSYSYPLNRSIPWLGFCKFSLKCLVLLNSNIRNASFEMFHGNKQWAEYSSLLKTSFRCWKVWNWNKSGIPVDHSQIPLKNVTPSREISLVVNFLLLPSDPLHYPIYLHPGAGQVIGFNDGSTLLHTFSFSHYSKLFVNVLLSLPTRSFKDECTILSRVFVVVLVVKGVIIIKIQRVLWKQGMSVKKGKCSTFTVIFLITNPKWMAESGGHGFQICWCGIMALFMPK